MSLRRGRVLLWCVATGLSLLSYSPKVSAVESLISSREESELTKGTGNLSGVILDESGSYLPGAILTLDRDNRYTVSAADGSFVFLGVPAGTYTLSVKYIGFEEYSSQVTVIEGKNSSIKVKLKESTFTTGEVVVVGELAKGQARAINTERSNSNITNMVSADHIGRFPDSNVGDALKRIPGITMQNDQGEARNIVMRGLAPHLNSVTLNGGRIPSAEGDNRNVQMDLIPSDMISMIEVNKTLLPDMEADAIGGSVNLVTKTAPRSQNLSINVGGGYNMIRNRPTINGSLTYGNHFFDEKLGMVVSLSYQNKDYGSDNIEGEWTSKDSNVFLKDFQIRKYDVQRIRRSGSINMDYRFNSSHSIYLKTLYNWRDDRENRFRYRMSKMSLEKDGTYSGRIDRQTKGGIDNDRNRNRRLEDQRVYDIALGGEHLLRSKIDMNWGISFSRASEHRPHERYINMRQKKVLFGQDLSDTRYPMVTAQNESLDKFGLDTLSESEQMTYEDEWGGKLNFRFPFSVIPKQKGRIRVGAKIRLKEKDRDNIYYEYEPKTSFPSFKEMDLVEWNDPKFLNGKGYVPGVFPSKTFLGSLELNDPSKYESEAILSEYWTANYNAKENIYAGYLRWDQNVTNRFVIITGLRIEHTAIDYIGHTLVEDQKGENVKDNNSYTNFFPNLTFKYEPNKRTVLRAAYSTSIARPNYYWLVPYMNISNADHNISLGNSDLKSTYAHNVDLIASYYPGNVASLSAGLFYKRLNDFIYAYATSSFTHDDFAQLYPDRHNPIPEGEEWDFKTHHNGESVDIYGLEVSYNRQLDFLPSSFLRHLSLYLNYTYTHSKASGITNEDGEERKGMMLPGSAPHTVNASLAYEDKHFTARISYNFTSSYVDQLGKNDFEDRYYGSQAFLDFNANYKIKPNLQVFFDANNLLNTPLYYYQGERDRLMQLELYKPAFNAGIRWNL